MVHLLVIQTFFVIGLTLVSPVLVSVSMLQEAQCPQCLTSGDKLGLSGLMPRLCRVLML